MLRPKHRRIGQGEGVSPGGEGDRPDVLEDQGDEHAQRAKEIGFQVVHQEEIVIGVLVLEEELPPDQHGDEQSQPGQPALESGFETGFKGFRLLLQMPPTATLGAANPAGRNTPCTAD